MIRLGFVEWGGKRSSRISSVLVFHKGETVAMVHDSGNFHSTTRGILAFVGDHSMKLASKSADKEL